MFILLSFYILFRRYFNRKKINLSSFSFFAKTSNYIWNIKILSFEEGRTGINRAITEIEKINPRWLTWRRGEEGSTVEHGETRIGIGQKKLAQLKSAESRWRRVFIPGQFFQANDLSPSCTRCDRRCSLWNVIYLYRVDLIYAIRERKQPRAPPTPPRPTIKTAAQHAGIYVGARGSSGSAFICRTSVGIASSFFALVINFHVSWIFLLNLYHVSARIWKS